MANYCPNCGAAVDPSASYCSSCGAAVNGVAGTAAPSAAGGIASAAMGALGTLVAVSLIGGATRRLYYYGGRYFLDPYCRRPFASPHLILGGPRFLGGPRPMGGFHGPMGGPRGGGPRGGGPGGRR